MGLTCSCQAWTFCPAAGRSARSPDTDTDTSPDPEAGWGGTGPGTRSCTSQSPSAGWAGRRAARGPPGPRTHTRKCLYPVATQGHSCRRSAHSDTRSCSSLRLAVYLAHTAPEGRGPPALFQMDKNERITLFIYFFCHFIFLPVVLGYS